MIFQSLFCSISNKISIQNRKIEYVPRFFHALELSLCVEKFIHLPLAGDTLLFFSKVESSGESRFLERNCVAPGGMQMF